MSKVRMVRKSLKAAAQQSIDLEEYTPVEQVVAITATKAAAVGGFGVVCAKFAAGAIAAKAMAVGGLAVAGGVFAKGFVRGYREEMAYQKEKLMSPEDRWRKENGLAEGMSLEQKERAQAMRAAVMGAV